MSFEHGAGFRICGAVVRKFVPPSGKCAFVDIATPGKKGEIKHELRTFDYDLIVEVGSLGVGQIVQVTGSVESETLKDKGRNDVKVDGRTAWVSKLTIRALTVEGASIKPAVSTPPASSSFDDSDPGF